MRKLVESDIANWIKNQKMKKVKIHSNCYFHFTDRNRIWDGVITDNSLVINNDDNGVNRIYFFTSEFGDLCELFSKELEPKKEYLIDIITKDKLLYNKELASAGFEYMTSMKRMSNRDISEIMNGDSSIGCFENEHLGQKATELDAEAIKSKLWEIFDTRISHLPNLYGVKEGIKNGEYIVYKDQTSDILALLQRIVKPSSFYINQIYNETDRRVIHSILLNELRTYYNQGGRYIYAWVEDGNIASEKFHGKYGMQPDGLADIVYRKEA